MGMNKSEIFSSVKPLSILYTTKKSTLFLLHSKEERSIDLFLHRTKYFRVQKFVAAKVQFPGRGLLESF